MDEQHNKRCERFNELPEYTKLFLERLRADDVIAIEEGIKLSRAARTVGKFWKWTAVAIVSTFAGVVTIITAFKTIGEWFRGQ